MNLRPYGPGMASDAIALRCGFDGKESDDLIALHQAHAGLGGRCTFAVNTHYPEVVGGYFENRALYEVIDAALRHLGLLPVLDDHYDPAAEGVIPIEGPGQLCVDENYALLHKEGCQQGMLLIWRFHAGGGGSYYSDNVIFDFILPQTTMQALADDVERRCRQLHVRFTRCPTHTNLLRKRHGWIGKAFDRLRSLFERRPRRSR